MPRSPRWYASAMACLLLSCASGVLAQAPAPRTPRSPTVLSALEQGKAFLDADDLERARAQFEAVLSRDPASADAQFLLGVVHERRKDFSAAARLYTAAIGAAPRMAEAHDRLGFVLGQQGQTAD